MPLQNSVGVDWNSQLLHAEPTTTNYQLKHFYVPHLI